MSKKGFTYLYADSQRIKLKKGACKLLVVVGTGSKNERYFEICSCCE